MTAQQNLVPNGSFEDTLGCPNNYDQLYKAKYWYKPTLGTSDYFNSCDITNAAGVPLNGIGYQYAHTGNSYAGFGNSFDTTTLFREYLQVKLTSKLVVNKKYEISFYLSRANNTGCALANIGCVFSNLAIGCNCNTYLNYSPHIVSSKNQFLTDTLNWMEVKGEYTAIGNEEYLTIGYFNKSNDTLLVDLNTNDYSAYYYLDDVSVVCLEKMIEIPNVFSPNNDGVNDLFYIDKNFVKPIELIIYNRWGNKVFDSKHNFTWDGRTTSGEPCNIGTYYYIIQTDSKTFKGFLELIR